MPLFRRYEPYQLMLVLALGGSLLTFGFLLLAYLLRTQAQPAEVALPRMFWFSTALMLLSSGSLYSATRALHNEHFLNYRLMLALTLLLGIGFLMMQLLGWSEMLRRGQTADRNVAAAFVYVLSGLHLFHLLIGLFFLGKALWDALLHRRYTDAYVFSINPSNQARMNLLVLFWHFLDALWVLVFLFLLYHHRQ